MPSDGGEAVNVTSLARRGATALFFLLAAICAAPAQPAQQTQPEARAPQSPEAPFTAWLMNNEARAMAILAGDRLLADRISEPFGLLGAMPLSPAKSEQDIWSIHLQYYRFLPEAVEIAKLARRFGSGEFARVFDQAFPGNWVCAPMVGIPTFNAREVALPLNTVFRENILVCMGVDKDRDADLTERLKRSQNTISADNRRLLGQYFETFLALYPNNRQVQAIDAFLKNGMKKSTAQGVASALGLNTASASESGLAFDDGANGPAAAVASATDTDTGSMPADLFNILK